MTSGLDRTALDTELGTSVVGKFGAARLSWTRESGDRLDRQTFAIKFTKPF